MLHSLKYTKTALRQNLAPLISGQILFLQVSRQTNTAMPDANRNIRRSEVRAKNLAGDKPQKTHEHSASISCFPRHKQSQSYVVKKLMQN